MVPEDEDWGNEWEWVFPWSTPITQQKPSLGSRIKSVLFPASDHWPSHVRVYPPEEK